MQPREKVTGAAYWRRIAGVIAFMVAVICLVGYAAHLPTFFIAIISAAGALMFFVIALQGSTEIVEVAKQRSPKRCFTDRVREPDPEFSAFLAMLSHVVPWSIAFFGVGVFAIRIMAEAFFGRPSVVTTAMDALLALVLRAVIPTMVVAYAALWSLRGFVAVRLRRDGNVLRHDGPRQVGEPRGTAPPTPNNGIQADAQEDARG